MWQYNVFLTLDISLTWLTIASSQSPIQKQQPEVSYKKGVLKNFLNFTGKYLCQSLFFNNIAGLGVCNFIKNEVLERAFSCEIYEILKNTFLYRTPLGDCFWITSSQSQSSICWWVRTGWLWRRIFKHPRRKEHLAKIVTF